MFGRDEIPLPAPRFATVSQVKSLRHIAFLLGFEPYVHCWSIFRQCSIAQHRRTKLRKVTATRGVRQESNIRPIYIHDVNLSSPIVTVSKGNLSASGLNVGDTLIPGGFVKRIACDPSAFII